MSRREGGIGLDERVRQGAGRDKREGRLTEANSSVDRNRSNEGRGEGRGELHHRVRQKQFPATIPCLNLIEGGGEDRIDLYIDLFLFPLSLEIGKE